MGAAEQCLNSIHPGFIDTSMLSTALRDAPNGAEMTDHVIAHHAMSHLGQPREIAAVLVFLASDESSFMTGSELVTDREYTAK
jgi:NAD(P)-dependent dehydrogenase (short-subunit alcohol dehydrogenase family)